MIKAWGETVISIKHGQYELMKVRWYHRFWRWLIGWREINECNSLPIGSVKLNLYANLAGQIRGIVVKADK